MMNGVVTGLDRKVIAAPIGILARNGSASRATPNICTPGIRKKMPTNSPSAVPRGTDVRVKRHKWLCATRCANGRIKRLASSSSRVGELRRIQFITAALSRDRSEEHTSELQSLLRNSYSVV